MPLHESLSTIKRVDPNDHVFFVKLVRELEEIPSSFTGFELMNSFYFV
jgi:hypothetical protein